MVGCVDVLVLNSNAKVRRGDCGLRMMGKIIYKMLNMNGTKRKTFGHRTKERGIVMGLGCLVVVFALGGTGEA